MREYTYIPFLLALLSLIMCSDNSVVNDNIPPLPPEQVEAQPSNKSVILSWKPSLEASSYLIYWDTTGQITKEDKQIEVMTSPYTVSELTNGKTYFFAISAKNSFGESDLSKEVFGTPVDSVIDSLIPQNIQLVPGNKMITVSWDVVNSATEYTVYWKDSPGITKNNATKAIVSENTYLHTGLTNGQIYYYRVCSRGANGESALSIEVSDIPSDNTTDSNFIEDILVTSDDSSVTITWKKVNKALQYNIYWHTDPYFSIDTVFKDSVYTNLFIHRGLVDTQTYYYVITSVTAQGESARSHRAHCGAGRERLKWKYRITGHTVMSPTIGSNNVIYFFGPVNKILYALRTDGSVKWKKRIHDGFYDYSKPSLSSDGTLYIACNDHNVYALDAETGIEKWTFTTKNSVQSTPAIASDGSIYVSGLDNTVYALTPQGTEKWKFIKTDKFLSSVAIAKDRTIYATCADNHIYAINPDGTQKWKYFDNESGIGSGAPAIASDGKIYVMGMEELIALNPDGTLIWEKRLYSAKKIISIDPEGVIYMFTRFNNDIYALNAINPDGSDKWEYKMNSPLGGCVIGNDGTIFFGDHRNDFLALSANGEEIWKYPIIDYCKTPVLSDDGTLYFGSNDGFMYAIKSGCSGMAESGWPSYFYDLRNTRQQR